MKLSAVGIRKRYGEREVVKGISLTVGSGEIVGLLGPNGAGKTSVIKMLLALVRPDAGEVLLLGSPARDPKARTRVGYLPELFRYQPWLTAAETSSRANAPSAAEPSSISATLVSTWSAVTSCCAQVPPRSW